MMKMTYHSISDSIGLSIHITDIPLDVFYSVIEEQFSKRVLELKEDEERETFAKAARTVLEHFQP